MRKLSAVLLFVLGAVIWSALAGCGEFLHVESLGIGDGGLEVPLTTVDGAVEAASADGSSGAPDAAVPYVFIPTPTAPSFVDDFTRPDGVISNGWAPRVDAFAIASGSVRTMLSGGPDQIVRRPEMFLDLEVSVIITYGSPYDEPALFVRLQPTEEPKKYIGYRAWFSATFVSIEARSSSQSQLARADFSPSLVVGRRYSLHVRIRGTDPVTIDVGVFAEGGAHLASVQATDSYPSRIVAPGRMGFGAREQETRFDDFRLIE